MASMRGLRAIERMNTIKAKTHTDRPLLSKSETDTVDKSKPDMTCH